MSGLIESPGSVQIPRNDGTGKGNGRAKFLVEPGKRGRRPSDFQVHNRIDPAGAARGSRMWPTKQC
jgi:hypothetical protein